MGVSAARPQRTGVFGGAFDPPHNAHVALARSAVDALALDELLVVPTGAAWHKTRSLSPSDDRLAMARLAFANLPRTAVDARELHRSGPSYTLDTLHELQAERPGVELWLVLGADQGRQLTSWHGWREILKIATIVIAERPDSTRTGGTFDAEIAGGGQFARLPFTPVALSATDIRRRVAAHEAVDALVPPAVARYIAQHHLYLNA